VENVEPAKTLLAISPHLEKYLKEAKQSKKGKSSQLENTGGFFQGSFLQSQISIFHFSWTGNRTFPSEISVAKPYCPIFI
jgi:hypothetical protein